MKNEIPLTYLHLTMLSKMGTKDVKMSPYTINGKKYLVIDNHIGKVVVGEDYNFIFDKTNGDFKRWGKTYEEDPLFSPLGPEILDIEISVNGCPNNCKFCYKNNKATEPTNMTFETFKGILDSFSPALTQIAFGITGIQTNPDFIKMMEYCKERGVIPNFTLSGIDLTDEIALKCSKLVGALAVSAYRSDKNVCYNTVKKFVDLGINQTNIHLMVSQENIDFVYEVLNDRLTDPRLKQMGAIVFLGVKPKGRAKGQYHSLPVAEYEKLIGFCFGNNISVGFDSCSAPKFEAAVKKMDISEKKRAKLLECSESCESSLFSSYINVYGKYWHCSFAEGELKDGVECVGVKDFLTIWYSDIVKKLRDDSLKTLTNGCRHCNIFPEINC